VRVKELGARGEEQSLFLPTPSLSAEEQLGPFAISFVIPS